MIFPFNRLLLLASLDWHLPKALLVAWWARSFLVLVCYAIILLVHPVIPKAEPYTTPHTPPIAQNTSVDSANKAQSTHPQPLMPPAFPRDTLGNQAMAPDQITGTTNRDAEVPNPSKQFTSRWEIDPLTGHTLGGMGSTYGVPPNSNAMIGKNAPRQPVLRVGILGIAQDRKRTMTVAALLQDHQYGNLEKRIGMQVDVVRIITARRTGNKDRIRHRPGFLKAALQLANILPGQQTIRKWYQPTHQTAKHAVDVEISLKQSHSKNKKP